jgi:hypothetical protein
VAVATGLIRIRLASLTLLLRRLAFFAAVAPALVVALPEAAGGLDHAEIVVGVLPIGLRHDAIARGRCLAGQRLVLVEYLMGIAPHADVGPAGVKDLVSIRRTVGVVMLFVMMAAGTAAATIATAARPLTIVWSHYLKASCMPDGCCSLLPSALHGRRQANFQRDKSPGAIY